ncbi:hypothetical protein GQ55_6G239600 [Panicum hallii var. hallii]|uniref:Uncharacterized protein n=1 Tax=Panicum hallii var. hallii TaxID=1504633 RepID=A0A2T7D8X6_9POAL|nr:hypothetical protein GQ55_6G239600 [Panicum hallii var. hallii]
MVNKSTSDSTRPRRVLLSSARAALSPPYMMPTKMRRRTIQGARVQINPKLTVCAGFLPHILRTGSWTSNQA